MSDQSTLQSQSDTLLNPESKSDDAAFNFFRRLWIVVILGGLYFVMFQPELVKLVKRWNHPSEAHGYLIPLFSLYFLYLQRAEIKAMVCKPALTGLFLMLLSLWGYFCFSRLSWAYPRQVVMVSFLGGLVLYMGGWKMARIAWLPVIFLLFSMPLPARLHTAMTMPMREMASTVATIVLNCFPDVHLVAENVVIRGNYGIEPVNLNVADACSGMRLLRTFVALGVAMAYLEARPVMHRIVLLISTVPIAIGCNMLRVIITGMIHMFMGAEYATGTLHTWLGFITLAIAFILYGLLTWIINNLFVDEDDGEQDSAILKVGGAS